MPTEFECDHLNGFGFKAVLKIGYNKVDLTPTRILKSGVATIVFWNDGTKTIVKRAKDEPDNAYTAFCAALAKKIFNSNSQVRKIVETKTEEQKLIKK